MNLLKILMTLVLPIFTVKAQHNISANFTPTPVPSSIPSPIPTMLPSHVPTLSPTKYWDECRVILESDDDIIIHFFEEVMQSILDPFSYNLTTSDNEVLAFHLDRTVAEFCKDTILLELSLGLLTLRSFTYGYDDLSIEERLLYSIIIDNFLTNTTIIVETRSESTSHDTTTTTKQHTHMDYLIAMSVFIVLSVIVSIIFIKRKCKERRHKKKEKYDKVKSEPILK